MEKAILTEDQAEAIVRVLNDEDSFGWVLDAHSHGPKSWVNRYEGLNGMDIDALARALYIGYEIEPEEPKFKVGSKVLHPDQLKGFSVSEIIEIPDPLKAPNVYILRDQRERVFHGNELRHAIPEEIYWLEILGREKVGDFKIGDVFMGEDGEVYHVEDHVELIDAVDWYADRDFKGIYPAESFKPFPKDE